ncbi:hypothetical protein OAO18_00170 [Francisellaceae bacterium]|nr:hypothetical protein [Francisellaceae bacterium]
MSWIAHFIASYAYSLIPSDSFNQFFTEANINYFSVGTQFIKNLTWYVREYVTGDSYLGTLYFFSVFAFIGSVLWFCLYLRIAQLLSVRVRQQIFPALVIMCWPSFLFFTSGIGKDSLSYFFIPLICLAWLEIIYIKRNIACMCIILLLSGLVLTLIRPYLAMVFMGALYLSTFKGVRSLTFLRILGIVIIVPIALFVVQWVLSKQGGIHDISVTSIAERALAQKENLSKGTSFPILSDQPILVLLLLPYSMLMNLIMPLFVFANNITGLIASFENLFLLGLIFYFWKNRKIFKNLCSRCHMVKLTFCFFIVGMAFLGLINTNLGLAMRQKSMYLPALLVVIMLVWQFKKQSRIK